MKTLIAILLIAITMLTCSVKLETNPVAADPYITAGNYFIQQFYYRTISSNDGMDTLRLQTQACHCIVDTLVTSVITSDYIYYRQSDTLHIELERLTDFVMEGNTVSMFGIFHRVSPDTGIRGTWQLHSRCIFASDSLTYQDSITTMNYNPGIEWLQMAPDKITIYYCRDSIPSYTTQFKKKYSTTLRNYAVQIDSLSDNSLNLVGIISRDVVTVAIDSFGTVSYFIQLTSPDTSRPYQPNPYLSNVNNPKILQNNLTPCQKYPDWIHFFLNNNPLDSLD